MKQHAWQTYGDGDDDVDGFAGMDSGYHNGPLCVECGLTFCSHCNPELWDSECGETDSQPADNSKLDAGIVALDSAIRAKVGMPPVQ